MLKQTEKKRSVEQNGKKAFDTEEHAANAIPGLDWKTYHANSEKLNLGWRKK
jgi:hypothetical protein